MGWYAIKTQPTNQPKQMTGNWIEQISLYALFLAMSNNLQNMLISLGKEFEILVQWLMYLMSVFFDY